MSERNAYSCTVTSRGQFSLGVLIALGLVGAGIALHWPPWASLPAGVIVVVAAVQVSIVIGQGPWGTAGRRISLGSVRRAEIRELSWPEVFGLGMPLHWYTIRQSVRPGATLELELTANEHIRVSVLDARAALGALGPATTDGVR